MGLMSHKYHEQENENFHDERWQFVYYFLLLFLLFLLFLKISKIFIFTIKYIVVKCGLCGVVIKVWKKRKQKTTKE